MARKKEPALPQPRPGVLAVVLGVSPQLVSDYSAGRRAPDVPRLLAMATLYGVDPLGLMTAEQRAVYDVIVERGRKQAAEDAEQSTEAA